MDNQGGRGMGDAFDTDEQHLSADERQARRVLALALEFMNARGPLAGRSIHESFYPDRTSEAARKAFRRDREVLALCGLAVVRTEAPGADDDSLWTVDQASSYVTAPALSAEDAAMVDIVCSASVGDPSFPFGPELRLALAKINPSFDADGATRTALPADSGSDARTLQHCLVARHAARCTYTDAAGQESARDLAPLGLFGIQDRSYVVAARLAEGVPSSGEVALADEPPHTYRIDRFGSVSELARVSFAPPADFDVDDYLVLPFQIGEEQVAARFLVPDASEPDVRRDARNQGMWEHVDDGWLWEVPARDAQAASAWAIERGIVPAEAGDVAKAYRSLLEGVSAHG